MPVSTKAEKATQSLKVRATQDGYYGHGSVGAIYRYGPRGDKPGDVFTITPREVQVMKESGNGYAPVLNADGTPKMRVMTCEEQFSDKWMEIVSNSEPEQLTTAAQAMKESDLNHYKGID